MGQFADEPPCPCAGAVPPYEGALPLAGVCVEGGTSWKPDEPDVPDEPDDVDGVVVVVDDAA